MEKKFMTKLPKVKINPPIHITLGAVLLVIGIFLITKLISIPASSHAQPPTKAFTYGFDLDANEPDQPSTLVGAENNQYAVNSALSVLSNFKGSTINQPMENFGVGNPEPSQGNYQDTSTSDNLSNRINMITNAGGIPIMSLVSAPDWMKACNPGDKCPGASTNPNCVAYNNSDAWSAQPPCPYYFSQFADLAAHIAKDYPQIKYFIVWAELRGFGNKTTYTYPYGTTNIDIADYTTMYNDVYNAIKAVAPNDQVGGPYTSMSAAECTPSCPSGSLNGPWGYVTEDKLVATEYWLKNKVGADFIAVDGHTEIASYCSNSEKSGYSCVDGPKINIDPASVSQQYAAVDDWLKNQTDLPIWWIESHIQPNSDEGAYSWTDSQAAAARIATLVAMNTSGATVGMQWQSQDSPQESDMGLWTSTVCTGGTAAAPCGGVATPLANELIPILSFISQRLTPLTNLPTGVVAASASGQDLVVNTLNSPVEAAFSGDSLTLAPDQVLLFSPTNLAISYSSIPTPTNIRQASVGNEGSSSKSTSSNSTKASNVNTKNLTNSATNQNIQNTKGKIGTATSQPTILASRRKYFFLAYGLAIIGLMNIGAGFLRWVLYLG